MDVAGKRVLVVGLGKSGLAAARFLKKRGARVTVSDARPSTLIAELPTLLAEGIMVESGSHGVLTFRRQDLIVVSPGVPMDVPEIAQARAMGVEIIGEMELGFQFLQAEVIAITGSNGKTTTTTLVGEILKAAGVKTLVGGNIGRPVVDLAEESMEIGGDAQGEAGPSPLAQDDKPKELRSDEANADSSAALRNDKQEGLRNDKQDGVAQSNKDVWAVLEVSSFQLETIETFKPRIAMVLNITPDHLDRHGSFAVYAAMKARITENQAADDFLVLNAEDVKAQGVAAKTRAQIYWFSGKRRIKQGAFVHGDGIYFVAREGGEAEPVMPLSEIPLVGAHNVENVLAATCAARLAGVEASVIRAVVRGFKAVEHRLEFVRELEGVRYFNDSKATNVDATVKAIEAFEGGVWLILGGKDKDSDYATMAALLPERVKGVITIGTAAEKIERQLAGVVKIERAETMERAVPLVRSLARSGDVVLLAPACASFDQFENYGHRGRVFKELVQGLM
jgi:UDP-N-acetylmuramoylalanine--D-glutamate ligase